MPPDSQTPVLFFPVDEIANTGIVSLPVLLFALPIVSLTLIFGFYFKALKLTYRAGRGTFRRLKKIF